MPGRQSLSHNGRQVTLVGPTAEDECVWIAQDGQGGIVYLSRETIAAALGQVPTYTAVPAEIAAAPAEPEAPAPAAAPAAAPAEPERPTCPACERAYTGELGTNHRCEGIQAVTCLNCRVVNTTGLGDPPRAGFICARCESQGYIVCKHCGRAKEGRGQEVCAQCSPLQPHDIWLQGIVAIGNDIMMLTKSHRPFAVEVESFRDPSQAEGDTPRLRGWNKGSDPSIQPDPGCDDRTEWRSPPFRGDGGLKQLREDVARIRKAGYRANKSCGLHVHIDMHDTSESDRAALHRFGTWLQDKGVFRLVAKSRARNRYCHRLSTFDADKGDKYKWMSIQSFQRHRTVEFRLHHGVTQPEIVAEWVKVCLRIVEVGLKLGHLERPPEASLYDLLGMTDYEKRFWSTTVKKLHGRTAEVA